MRPLDPGAIDRMVIVLCDRFHVPSPTNPKAHAAWRHIRPSTIEDLETLRGRVDHLIATCSHHLDSNMSATLHLASQQLADALKSGDARAFREQRLAKLREQQTDAKRALETAMASEHELLETLARMARP